MKHNYAREFVARNDKNRLYDRRKDGTFTIRHKRSRFGRTSLYADKIVGASPAAHDASGPTLQRSIYGAKHYVRSRFRFHEKMKLKKDQQFIDEIENG